MSFPRYPAYKDGGVAWFGEVPEHWQVAPLKAFIDRIESGVSVNATDTPAEVGQLGVLKTSCVYTGQFDAAENKAVVNAEYDRVACPVEANTLIVSRMNTPDLVGAAGLTKADHPTLFLPDRLWQVFPKDARADFMHFWTRTASYRAQVEMACAGTSSSMQNLGQDDFRSFMFVSPPPDEQVLIADFLDRETAKIDALVAEQEQLITLLKEKRQAVISHAVTKGLDPSVPMKDSGVEWLGEVPAHWALRPLKAVATFRSGGTPDKRNTEYWDGEVPWVSAKDLKVDRPVDSIDHITQCALDDGAAALVPEQAIVVVVRGMILARLFPVAQLMKPMAINQDLKALVPKNEVVADYLAWLLRASEPETLNCLDEAGHGTKALRMENWQGILVPVPPIAEQQAIAAEVDATTERHDQLVNEAVLSIELLRERRAALISAAVTGQIDVRGLAPAQAQAA